MSNKVYVQLKDKGTSFHDIEQGAGVVANRVGLLENSPKVAEWIRKGLLIELSESDGKQAIKEQEAEAKALADQAALKQNTDADTTAQTDKAKADQTKAEKKAEQDQAKKELTDARAKFKTFYEVDAPKGSTIEFLNKANADAEAGTKHVIAQEDLDNNPDLVEQGVKVGEIVYLPAEDTDKGKGGTEESNEPTGNKASPLANLD